jgi:ubiquinol-cytochrome c reductase iron-sulfur subunit
MSADGVDLKKRRLLTAATSVVAGVGTVYVLVPFVKAWNPSAKAKAAGAPVEADISKLEPGQMLRVKWRGKPVWVVSRTEQNLKDMEASERGSGRSRTPTCRSSRPIARTTRSIKPEYLVAVGICTHLGCSPTYRPDVAPADLGPDWKGGFFCACHGSRFDLAGRVYSGVPAPTNLEIPPHKYLSDTVILVGEDGGAA